MSNASRQSPSPTPILKQNFLDSFDENSLMDWLSRNGKNVVYAFVGLIALLIVVYRISNTHTTQSEKDYLQTANDFALFQKEAVAKNDLSPSETLQKLTRALSKNPELHAAYDGAIAQTLLNQNNYSQAQPFAELALNRTQSDNLSLYSEFANTTLLISQQQHAIALEKATTLQQSMLNETERTDLERPFGETLFAFNLLRIAMLNQQLGNKEAELQTWQEWKRYAGLDGSSQKPTKISRQAFQTLIQQLAVGTISLVDYITYRENVLGK